MPPETRYTTSSGDISIAYQVVGEGPPDVVVVPGFISHADYQWEIGAYRGLLVELARVGRMAVFDKRGIGLSERTLGLGTVEDRMDDIRAVMDAAGMERAHVVGVSEGGPLGIVFSATYPERVESLTIWASWARVRWAPDYPEGIPDRRADHFVDLVAEGWGSGHGMDLMVKNVPTDEGTRELVARMERSAATPTGVRKILGSNLAIDVRDVLPTVSVPTLVINRTDDPLVPIEIGRHIAEGIPGARFLELPGDWHVNADSSEETDCYDAIVEFITGTRPVHEQEVDRVLATVLFTDICESTARAAELGDRVWREILESTIASPSIRSSVIGDSS